MLAFNMKKIFILLMLGNLCFMTSQAQNKYLIKVNGVGGGSGGSTNAIDTLKRVSDSIYGRVAGGFKFQFKDTIPALKSVLARGNSANSSIYLLDTITSEPIIVNGISLEKRSSNDSRIGFFTLEQGYNQYLTKQAASQRGGTVYLPLQTTAGKKDTLATLARLNLYITGTDSQYLYKQALSAKSGIVYLPFQNNENKKDTLATLSDVRGGYKKYIAQIIDTGGVYQISVKENTLDSAITIDTVSISSQGIAYRINGHNSSFSSGKCIMLLGTGKKANSLLKTYTIDYAFINPNTIYIIPWEISSAGATVIRSGIMNISVEIRYYP